MGLDPQEVANIASESLKNEGRLDLTLFFEGLQQISNKDGAQLITLTKWEAEQLQNLLVQAGVSQATQTELFPEHYLDRLQAGLDEGVNLSLERLQHILKPLVV